MQRDGHVLEKDKKNKIMSEASTNHPPYIYIYIYIFRFVVLILNDILVV